MGRIRCSRVVKETVMIRLMRFRSNDLALTRVKLFRAMIVISRNGYRVGGLRVGVTVMVGTLVVFSMVVELVIRHLLFDVVSTGAMAVFYICE